VLFATNAPNSDHYSLLNMWLVCWVAQYQEVPYCTAAASSQQVVYRFAYSEELCICLPPGENNDFEITGVKVSAAT
jgi:hypothetical protein